MIADEPSSRSVHSCRDGHDDGPNHKAGFALHQRLRPRHRHRPHEGQGRVHFCGGDSGGEGALLARGRFGCHESDDAAVSCLKLNKLHMPNLQRVVGKGHRIRIFRSLYLILWILYFELCKQQHHENILIPKPCRL